MSLRHRSTFIPALIALAVLALAAFAAFGGGRAAGADERTAGARAVPANAIAYAGIAADRDGAQWRALEALADRVPGGADALARAEESLDEMAANGDLASALGGDLAIALLGIELAGADGPQADALVIATAADGDRVVDALSAAGFGEGSELEGRPTWTRDGLTVTVGGDTVIAATSRASLRDALEVAAGDEPALADDAAFRATVADLPSDPAVLAYLAPTRIAGILGIAASLLPEEAAAGMPDADRAIARAQESLGAVRGLGAAVRVEDGGVRIALAGDADRDALASLGVVEPEPYRPTLLDRAPADAIAVAAFRDAGPMLEVALEMARAVGGDEANQLDTLLQSLESTADVGVDEDLVPALSGEHLAVVRGAGEPAATLLLQPDDATAAASTIAALVGLAEGLDLPEGAPEAPAVEVAVDGGVVAVGMEPGLAAAPTASLAESAGFRALAAAAGLPGEVTGIVYVDGAAARSLAAEKAAEKGEQVPEAAEAIGGVLGWGTATGAELFIAVG